MASPSSSRRASPSRGAARSRSAPFPPGSPRPAPRPCLLLTAPLVLSATGAFAELTAEDVWAHRQEVIAAFGATLSGSAAREGDSLRVTGVTGAYTLPLGLGSVRWETDGMVFTDLGDGTVRHSVPGTQQVRLFLDLPAVEGLAGEVPLTLSYAGYDSVVSGAPGDVTTRTRFDRLLIEVGDLTLNLDMGEDLPRLHLFAMIEGSETVHRVRSGEMLTIQTAGETRRTVTDLGFGQFGLTSKSVSETLDSAFTSTIVLPRSAPPDPLNLGIALREGLSLTAESTVGSGLVHSVSYLDGELVSDDRQRFGAAAQSLGLDRAGLRIDGAAADMAFEARMNPPAAALFTVTLRSLSYDFGLPLLDDPEPQEARLSFAFGGLEGSEALWGLFGPVSSELQGPADADLSVRTRLRLLADLTDLLALEEIAESGEAPFELLDVELQSLGGSYGGAVLEGSGRVTFEPGANRPGPSLQPPTGAATFVLTGAYALLDKIGRSGLIPPSELSAARAAISGFFLPRGEDRLESTITFEPGGRVLVNGSPMPF